MKAKAKTIEVITLKNNRKKLNSLVVNALKRCSYNSEKRRIYPIGWDGSGNYITKHDFSDYVQNILDAQGYKYKCGNDAPRGGAAGEYYEVSRTAYDFIQSIRNKTIEL